MKCLKMIFGMVCIAFTFIISQEIIVSDTYAVSDITLTLDASSASSSWSYLCSRYGTGGAPSCSSYKYLSIVFNSDGTLNTADFRAEYYITENSRGNSFDVPFWYVDSNLLFLKNPDDVRVRLYNYNLVSADLDWSVDIVLSENNPYSSGIIPSGSLSITENGTYDVTNYAEAVVDVPTSSGGGDNPYHQDLVNIYYAIIICGAICLVLYFFYCIYRMIIKSTGGK